MDYTSEDKTSQHRPLILADEYAIVTWKNAVPFRSVAKTCHSSPCSEEFRCRLCRLTRYDEDAELARKAQAEELALEFKAETDRWETELETYVSNHAFGAGKFGLPRTLQKSSKQRAKKLKFLDLGERRASNSKPRRPQRDLRAREVREIERVHRRHLANVADFRQGMENWRNGLSIY